MDWFLYDIGLRHERVNTNSTIKIKWVHHWKCTLFGNTDTVYTLFSLYHTCVLSFYNKPWYFNPNFSLEILIPNLVILSHSSPRILGKVQTLFFSNFQKPVTNLEHYLNLRREIRWRQKNLITTTNYDVIVISPIYGQFGSIRRPNAGCKVDNS